MTVNELIEKLRELPGDPDLRIVCLRVAVHQEGLEKPGFVEARVDSVRLESNVINLDGWGWLQ